MKNNYEDKIREFLEKMTLEEKAGQLQPCGPSSGFLIAGAFEVSLSKLPDTPLNLKYMIRNLYNLRKYF